MKKALIFALSAIVLGGAQVASAQTYMYPSQPYQTVGCVQLSRDLSYGSRGTDVRQLQSFLVAQNYPGGGSWMMTGYFGPATQTAVRNFQSTQGIYASGWVDATTRAAMSRNCGYTYTPAFPSYPTYPTYPSYYPQQSSSVVLTSLSTNSAAQGTSVTIYGYGFDATNNNVTVGSYPLTNIVSSNGTSISFTVPYYVTGSVQVSVSNSRGTSNSLWLTVVQGSNCVNGYPYNTCNCSYTNTCPQTNISLSNMSPNSGATGITVTVYGSGFSTTNNTVHFGNGIIANVGSFNGTSLSFTVPSQLTGYGTQMVVPGTYNVYVTNAQGQNSNVLPYTVTSVTGSAPTISSVSGPTSLQTGVSGTWTLSVQNPNSTYIMTSVNWGDAGSGYAYAQAPQYTYQQGQTTLTFSHAYQYAGTYTVVFTVQNQQGQQTSYSATVTVTGSGSTGTVALTSVSPTSVRVGQQVVLTGNGFTAYDNNVHFGSGGARNIASFNNGTTIYYTIPAWISPCAPTAQVCTAQAIAVTPGTYGMQVSNSTGTTQTVYVTVLP